jgi:hypothetical protein
MREREMGGAIGAAVSLTPRSCAQVCDAIFSDCHGAGTITWDQVSAKSAFTAWRDSISISWQPKAESLGGGVLSNRAVQEGR